MLQPKMAFECFAQSDNVVLSMAVKIPVHDQMIQMSACNSGTGTPWMNMGMIPRLAEESVKSQRDR